MGICKSVKCRDVCQEWQHWHSQTACSDLAYSIKMLWITCYHSQSQLVSWRRVLRSWSTDDFLGFASLGQGVHVIKEEKCVEHSLFHKAKEWLVHSAGSKKSLDLLDCLEPILLFQCTASLVRGDGPVSSSSEVFLSGTNIAILTPKITLKYTSVYSIFGISMVL